MSSHYKFDENMKGDILLIITEATFGFCETLQYYESRCKLSKKNSQ